jgi:hypothetical protein
MPAAARGEAPPRAADLQYYRYTSLPGSVKGRMLGDRPESGIHGTCEQMPLDQLFADRRHWSKPTRSTFAKWIYLTKVGTLPELFHGNVSRTADCQ